MKITISQRQDAHCSNLASSTETTCQKNKKHFSAGCRVKLAVTCKLWQVSHCPRQGGVNSGKHSWTLGGVQWSWWPNHPVDCANAIEPPCWQETFNNYGLTHCSTHMSLNWANTPYPMECAQFFSTIISIWLVFAPKFETPEPGFENQ